MSVKTGQQATGGNDHAEYYYMQCRTCGVKLHLSARKCWKCGNRNGYNANTKEFEGERAYRSHNQDDQLYGIPLCDVDRCMMCKKVQAGHEPCDPIVCFGTGRGRCDVCNQHQAGRFACCQSMVAKSTHTPAFEIDHIAKNAS